MVEPSLSSPANKSPYALRSALALALGVLVLMPQAHAAEYDQQRYSPGVGGSDISAPLEPGWYVQMPLVAYHASKLRAGDGSNTVATPVNASLGGVPAQPQLKSKVSLSTDTYALLPRVTYISGSQLLGGNMGFTVMLPVLERRVHASFTPQVPAPLALYGAAVAGHLDGNNQSSGISDLEFAPLLHWEIGDHQSATVAATMIVPTGQYNARQGGAESIAANPGFGNYYTFRPSAQYAYIGDGWDAGGRTVVSFNTRNRETGYRTGNIFNLDWELMKSISDDFRAGLQGYLVRQFTGDSQNLSALSAADQVNLYEPITDGNKSRVDAIGPALAWLHGGGDLLVEGKFLQEYNARNHTEGQAVWLTVSKPL